MYFQCELNADSRGLNTDSRGPPGPHGAREPGSGKPREAAFSTPGRPREALFSTEEARREALFSTGKPYLTPPVYRPSAKYGLPVLNTASRVLNTASQC